MGMGLVSSASRPEPSSSDSGGLVANSTQSSSDTFGKHLFLMAAVLVTLTKALKGARFICVVRQGSHSLRNLNPLVMLPHSQKSVMNACMPREWCRPHWESLLVLISTPHRHGKRLILKVILDFFDKWTIKINYYSCQRY